MEEMKKNRKEINKKEDVMNELRGENVSTVHLIFHQNTDGLAE